MAITEVFPNPTVKQVIFQIRFPPVFSMESLVGRYQIDILDRFPESELLFRKHMVIAAGVELKDLAAVIHDESEMEGVEKIWRFKSEMGVEMNIRSGSLDMSSTSHKTYNNQGSQDRFRDVIEFAVSKFLKVAPIPKLTRVGLRYLDDCPVPDGGTAAFKTYYNTSLPLSRFPVKEAVAMKTESRVRRGEDFLVFREALHQKEETMQLILDTDAYAVNVPASDCLAVTDRLHSLIAAEFEASIKEPVYEHMRAAKEDDDAERR